MFKTSSSILMILLSVTLCNCGGTPVTDGGLNDSSKSDLSPSKSVMDMTGLNDAGTTTYMSSTDMASNTEVITSPVDMTPPSPALPGEYECIHQACVGMTVALYSGLMRCDQVNDLYCEMSHSYPLFQWRAGDTGNGHQPGPCKVNSDCADDATYASTCSLISGATWGRCCGYGTTCHFTN